MAGKGHPEQGPVAGTMDQVRPYHVQRRPHGLSRVIRLAGRSLSDTIRWRPSRADHGQKRDTGGRMGLETLYGTRRENV
jgi:hypothetical protein